MQKYRRKDIISRKNFYFLENVLAILKSFKYNMNLLKFIRYNSIIIYYKFYINRLKVRIMFRCLKTKYKANFNKKFKFSRLFLLKLIRHNFIVGFTKT